MRFAEGEAAVYYHAAVRREGIRTSHEQRVLRRGEGNAGGIDLIARPLNGKSGFDLRNERIGAHVTPENEIGVLHVLRRDLRSLSHQRIATHEAAPALEEMRGL